MSIAVCLAAAVVAAQNTSVAVRAGSPGVSHPLSSKRLCADYEKPTTPGSGITISVSEPMQTVSLPFPLRPHIWSVAGQSWSPD
jgi:hypothetical protein